MVKIASTVTFILAAAAGAFAQGGPVVNTPAALTTCVPAAVTYSGGTAPYFIDVIPGGQTSAAAIETFPTSQTTTPGTYTWTVNLPAGTSISFRITDSTGVVNYSQQVTIAAGSSTACVGQSLSAGSSATASGPASSSAAGSSSAASSSRPASSSSMMSSSMASSSAASSSTSRPASSAASAASSAASPAQTSARPNGAAVKGASILALVGAAAVAIAA